MIAFKKFEDLKQNLKEQREAYKRIVEKVYEESWDEMSVWIDHQNYK